MKLPQIGMLLAVFVLSGCVIVAKPPPSPGDVTFAWSFAGLGCGDVPQVAKVVLSIPGATLENDGVFPCQLNGYPSVVLHGLKGGNYSYTILARGYGNEDLYSGSGSFRVDGNVRVTIDLTPVGGASSYAYLTWGFPANTASNNPTCAQAGVTHVDVTIDGTTTRYPCETGQSTPGAQTPYLSAGTHTVLFNAIDATGYSYYRAASSLQTFAGAPVSAHYDLLWGVGGAAIGWTFTNGTTAWDCGQDSISTVYVNFEDAQGNLVYGSAGDAQVCTAAPIVYNYLQPGTYKVYLLAQGTQYNYRSNSSAPPTITVTAGQFVTAGQAITINMYPY